MGNSNQSIPQNTYKICMCCNKYGRLNDELQILNVHKDDNYTYNGESSEKLLLRCSQGHILEYSGNSKHINYCIEKIEETNSNKTKKDNPSEIDELKIEINNLKQEIEYLKNINSNNKNYEPYVPIDANDHIEPITTNSNNIQIVSAQLIE